MSERTKEMLVLRMRRQATLVVGMTSAINAAHYALEERGHAPEDVAYIFEAMEAKRDKAADKVVKMEARLDALDPGYTERLEAEMDELLGEA